MKRWRSRGLLGALVVALAGVAAASAVVSQQARGATAALPKVAVYAADHTAETLDVVSKLTASGLYSQVDNLSPLCCGNDPTPTLATLQQYAGVLVWSDYNFNDPTALGNVLADYVDGGGRVVVASFGFDSSDAINVGGRLVSGGYLPVTLGGYASPHIQGFLVADAPTHPLLAGVASFDGGSGSYHDTGLSLTSGATLVAHWSTDSEPLVACKGNVVALNFFPPSSDVAPSYWNTATDGVRLMTNALGAPCGGTITVVKHLVPSYDPGRFNLRIDGTTYKANAGNNGTTGQVTVAAGNHTVSETAGTSAVLGNYVPRIICSDGSAGWGTSLSGVHVNAGDHVTCTITNTRRLYKT